MARRVSSVGTKSWSGVFSAGQSGLTTTQAGLVSISIAENAPRETLLRSRGNVLLSATPDAATDSDMVGLGLIVVHSNAVAVGGTALPGPLNDMGADWLWHQFVPLNAGGDTALDDPSFGQYTRYIEIDSRAMRRVPPDHEVVLMGELSVGDFASVIFQAGIRLLFGH